MTSTPKEKDMQMNVANVPGSPASIITEDDGGMKISSGSTVGGIAKTITSPGPHKTTTCSSVVIEIPEEVLDSDRDVIAASESDTDFEEEAVDKGGELGVVRADDDDVKEEQEEESSNNGAIETEGGHTSNSPSSEGSNNSDVELGGRSSSRISSTQERFQEIEEKMLLVEERNREKFESLRRFSSQDRIFPDVRSSQFHTVAVTLTADFKPGDALAPYPTTFASKWDRGVVPLPCCPENVRILKRPANPSDSQSDQPTEVKVHMWDKIRAALNEPLLTCKDLASAMKSYIKFNGQLIVLEYTLENLMTPEKRSRFFSYVLPGMAKLCLSLPEIVTSGLPFLSRFMNYSITLSQKQIACLLANAFFSTFPNRFTYEDDFPSINFISLLTAYGDDSRISSMANKLLCILHYFERVLDDMPKGLVTYTRKSVRSSKSPEWNKSEKGLSPLITLNDGTIETDGRSMIQIDFANKFVGGGVLGHGCVQEEILFVIYPELLLSRLFTERLVSCEALVITGCERFSEYRGYASSFEFAGDFVDCTPWNSRGRKCTQIVAIDAQFVVKHTDQFHPQKLVREVNKAYIGFSYPPGSTSDVAVASGKWGCGAFKGDAHLKTILQLLAASQAGRQLVIFTFGDVILQNEIEEMYEKIKSMKIREVWLLLEQYNKLFCSRQKPAMNLHQFFTEYINVTSSTSKPKEDMDMEDGRQSSPATSFDSLKNTTTTEAKHLATNAGARSEVNFRKRPLDNSGRADWLQKFETTKADWKILKTDNSTVANFDFDHKQSLNDEQIAALLDESERMDVETGEVVQQAVDSGSKTSHIASIEKHPQPELRKDLSSTAGETKSPLFPKRTQPNLADSEAGDSSSSVQVASGIPKQKRQMTLKDFFEPL